MNDDRTDIDPDGRYPANDLRRVEASARRVLGMIPGGAASRTRDATQIDVEGAERHLGVVD